MNPTPFSAESRPALADTLMRVMAVWADAICRRDVAYAMRMALLMWLIAHALAFEAARCRGEFERIKSSDCEIFHHLNGGNGQGGTVPRS